MRAPPVGVGMEVSTAPLDVARRPTEAGWHVNHEAAGIAGLVERRRTVQPPWSSWRPRAGGRGR
jgi:hypothetical protein